MSPQQRARALLSTFLATLALTACSTSGQGTPSLQPASTGQPTTSVESQPTASLDPATVAGSLLFVDEGDIHVHKGTQATQLTNTPETESFPSWSADGSRIVFTRENDVGESDLFSVNADGSGEKQLTKTKLNEELGAWSPDGRTVAFSTFTEAAGGSVWLMNADGTKPHSIYSEEVAFVGLADWAPDGRSLLITIDRGGGGQLDLYAIGVNGKGLTQLTTASGDDSGGRWSPNGDRIVFWSDGNPQGAGIYLMNPDGSDQRRILEDTLDANTVAPAWSPSGDQIAWTAKFEGGGGSPIFLMASDGSGLQLVRGELAQASTLDWSR